MQPQQVQVSLDTPLCLCPSVACPVSGVPCPQMTFQYTKGVIYVCVQIYNSVLK